MRRTGCGGELYRDKFHLNDTELGIISDLLPPGQMLIRKAQSSKKVQLNVDSVSYWMATNNAKDNLRKREYFERHGIPEGLRQLARDYRFSPHQTSEPRPAAAPTIELRPTATRTMPQIPVADTEMQTGVVQ